MNYCTDQSGAEKLVEAARRHRHQNARNLAYFITRNHIADISALYAVLSKLESYMGADGADFCLDATYLSRELCIFKTCTIMCKLANLKSERQTTTGAMSLGKDDRLPVPFNTGFVLIAASQVQMPVSCCRLVYLTFQPTSCRVRVRK